MTFPERTTSRDLGESVTSRMHNRNDSGVTGAASTDYSESQAPPPRRHDFDVQSMETSLNTPKLATKNPIAAPNVSIRSEFPTLTRSRQQQSLTCLVTVEVAEPKWRSDPETPRSAPPVPTLRQTPSRQFAKTIQPNTAILESMTERLRQRVDNWHGLDVSRFGRLYLHAQIRVGKDRRTWQDLECYLFSEMLICVKEKRMAPEPGAEPRMRCNLKGSILIKKHLRQVDTSVGKFDLLSDVELN